MRCARSLSAACVSGTSRPRTTSRSEPGPARTHGAERFGGRPIAALLVADRTVASRCRGRSRARLQRPTPRDVSPAAHVAGAARVATELGLGSVVVVGQSIGGLAALSLAARHPEIVRGLVLVDASPTNGAEDADLAARAIGDALRSWPVPFTSHEQAHDFFTTRFASVVAADAWTQGLEQHDDGWWPRFAVDVMVRTLRGAVTEPRRLGARGMPHAPRAGRKRHGRLWGRRRDAHAAAGDQDRRCSRCRS
jgi:pimeloyl-ACP methyl ester carboxylesterase